jgi:hypothetical protein
MHKYGFHVNRTGDDVFDAIRRIRPRVIKSIEHDIGFWTRVRQLLPDLFLIGRLVVDLHEQERFVEAPAAAGRAFAERILRLEANRVTVQGRPLFDAWESYNEVLAGDASPELKRAYDEFQVAFAGPLRAAGFEPIAMNFGTGNMLGADFLDYFAGTLATYTYLGFHEYDWPDLWRLHEQNIHEKNEGGMWLALRYRRVMGPVRQVYGDRHRVIITECGMTQGVQGGSDVGPWHESHPISEQRYWDSLMWYNDELLTDDYVMAACLFVVGAVPPWQSFEHLGGIINRLERLQAGNPPPVATRPRLPTSPPARPPVQPPVQPPAPPGDDAFQRLLLEEGLRQQAIQLNPQAALQRRLLADGFVPTSNEFSWEFDGRQYIAQQAEKLGSGERRVYYALVGDGDNIQFAAALPGLRSRYG